MSTIFNTDFIFLLIFLSDRVPCAQAHIIHYICLMSCMLCRRTWLTVPECVYPYVCAVAVGLHQIVERKKKKNNKMTINYSWWTSLSKQSTRSLPHAQASEASSEDQHGMYLCCGRKWSLVSVLLSPLSCKQGTIVSAAPSFLNTFVLVTFHLFPLLFHCLLHMRLFLFFFFYYRRYFRFCTVIVHYEW